MVWNKSEDPLSPVKVGCEVSAEEKRNSFKNSNVQHVHFDEDIVEFFDISVEVKKILAVFIPPLFGYFYQMGNCYTVNGLSIYIRKWEVLLFAINICSLFILGLQSTLDCSNSTC